MTTATIIRPRVHAVAGVCAGVAEHLGWSVSTVRLIALASAAAGGAGILLYLWLWATTPLAAVDAAVPLPKLALTPQAQQPPSGSVSEAMRSAAGSALFAPPPSGSAGAASSSSSFSSSSPAPSDESRLRQLRRAPVAEVLLGIALVVVGVVFVFNRFGSDISLTAVIPAIVIFAGAALAWMQFADLRKGNSGSRSRLVVRSLGALLLVAIGILLFFVTSAEPNVWTVIAAAISVLLGVGIVALPWILRLSNDLVDERAARERAGERAEIAAHLHDSVLQTLALIQQKSDPQSDAARLARAQELELREWLFVGAGPVRMAGAGGAESTETIVVAERLRAVAHEIERDFPVRFELVTVGEAAAAPEGLVMAAREAMLNAARHAGGDVSVFLETSPAQFELIVTDRGPGMVIADIPADRLGVRESIIGRLSRIGGTATIGGGRGGTGTSVTLRLPRVAAPGEEAHTVSADPADVVTTKETADESA